VRLVSAPRHDGSSSMSLNPKLSSRKDTSCPISSGSFVKRLCSAFSTSSIVNLLTVEGISCTWLLANDSSRSSENASTCAGNETRPRSSMTSLSRDRPSRNVRKYAMMFGVPLFKTSIGGALQA
jgi:hypothetical protein